MPPTLTPRATALRALIADFIRQRRDDKLDKLAPDDDAKREALLTQHQPAAWLADAARRAGQLQAATHTLKAVHPDARGSNLYAPPSSLPARREVGSHCLSADFADDVVGNAAALDVYKFLKQQHDGQSLLALALAQDADLAAALSDDAEQAQAWIAAFAALTDAGADAASHSRAKQVYWLVGYEPAKDEDYHLLAPLYPSALAQRLYQTIQEHRFGEAAKAARQARREQRDHPHGYCDYPQLAVQKLGGTKPQNISQLNSERKGNNYLLASLPPQWRSLGLKPPLNTEDALLRFGRRNDVRRLVRQLRAFLESQPRKIMDTRDRRDELSDALLEELLLFGKEMHEGLPPGWSAEARCRLPEYQQLWLDPWRADADADFAARWHGEDWPLEVAKRFGRWLNQQFDASPLEMGDAEFRHWARELAGDLGWQAQHDQTRRQLAAMAKEQA